MNKNDDKLRALLRQWRDIEPPANFDANVRRRIRQASAERTTWAELLEQLTWRPALAAVMVSVVVGTSVAVVTLRRPAAPQELQFMSAGTLAGGYAKLATEGGR